MAIVVFGGMTAATLVLWLVVRPQHLPVETGEPVAAVVH
jgi:DHA1 family bicyclomycin/chloramphenicol resistance-like MFS transporter